MNRIKNWVTFTFIFTFLVILAGGVVRTTQSGMGCPDFPTCFGRMFPPLSAPPDADKYLKNQKIDVKYNPVHAWTEYINRLMGAALGLLGIINCWLIYNRRKEMQQAWKLALIFLGLVIITGIVGAIVVKLNLAHSSISVHLLLAISMTQVALALMLTVRGKMNSIAVEPAFKKIVMAFIVILFIQSALGTVVRMHVDDISGSLDYTKRELWLADKPVAFIIHRSYSWVVLAAGVFLLWRFRSSAMMNKLKWLFIYLLLNMAAGITLFYADMPAIAQPIHLLLAAVSITHTVSMLLLARKLPG